MRTSPEIPLAPGTIAIADLHLDVGDAELVRGFVRWLTVLERPPRLVILGDLFDVWVGRAQERMPGAPLVLDALKALRERGCEIAIVPGNRDFLLGRSFERRTGVELFREGFVGTSNGARTLFVHGDTLCTKDVGYQRLRRVLRSRPVRWLAPCVPLPIGTRVARRLRRASVKAIASKLPEEKSIQRDAVYAAAEAARCTRVVCGHAHEFRDETLAGGVRWIVLDAFGGVRDLVRIGNEGAIEVGTSASRV
jgi:UDP-2,3-diacylglucosamine hydrolase